MELLLAMIITAMVAGAIAGMLGAVSSGLGTKKDDREVMVLAHAAQCRISAYLATSRCVLAQSGSNLTLWLNDSRESGTVHATEIRWLRFDSIAGALVVQYVDFPAAWTATACELADNEYAANTDWETVRAAYQTKGLLASRTLIDHLSSASILRDQPTIIDARHIAYNLTFQSDHAGVGAEISGTIQEQHKPVK